jgi:hypothetical protein
MGTGDPDLYKAFCWRFWHLAAAEGGRIGVVLPRNALAAKGSMDFRKTMIENSSETDLTLLLNNKKWVFAEVHPQYTIALVALTRGSPRGKSVHLRGPCSSLSDFRVAVIGKAASFSGAEVLSWNDTATLPLLPSAQAGTVFAQLRASPRLDLNDGSAWRARPDTELHATNQKDVMDLDSERCPKGFWPVFKGESFDLWNPDTGHYYAWADPGVVTPWLVQKRMTSGSRRSDSAHSEFPPEHLRDSATLACHAARVAFRNVTNRTNRRTVIAALIPPKVFLTNAAPFLLWPRGDERDQAFLLGVLSSVALDWYARRFVEINLNFFLFNPLPIPRARRADDRWQRSVALAGRLACPDDRFATWAKAVGVKVGVVQEAEKNDMIQELDAVVAHLYGLSEPQLRHIFETFHDGWDYHSRLDATLKHYRAWAKRAH